MTELIILNPEYMFVSFSSIYELEQKVGVGTKGRSRSKR